MLKIIQGDALQTLRRLKDNCIQTCVTSPPYWGLRDYGVLGQLGLEKSPNDYVAALVEIFREVRRVLKPDGTLWLNLGDSYASSSKGSGGAGKSTLGPNKDLQNIQFQKMKVRSFNHGLKEKDLVGIPWRVAFALQQDGWYLRQDIIWAKPNPMPESVRDRCTKSHEYLFMLSKNPKYYYDADAVAEPAINSGKRVSLGERSFSKRQADGAGVKPSGNGNAEFYDVKETRNRRSVWTITTKPFKEAHFATFPPDLVEPCILAGSPPSSVILDPFAGSGTVGLVAQKLNRHTILIELNAEYVEMAKRRCGLTPVVPRTTIPTSSELAL